MRKFVYDFSLLNPISPDVTIASFPRDQVDRLFTKSTHFLDWRRFFWIGIMVKLARAGALDRTGRYRVEVSYIGLGNYECTLLQML